MKKLTLLLLATSLHAHSLNQLITTLKKEQIQFVDYLFTDIHGNLKEVTRPISFTEDSCKNGLFFDGSSIPGCSSITKSDMLLKPQLATLTRVPWLSSEVKTARLICDIYEDAQHPYAASPRVILQELLNEAYEMGYEFYVGPELEFFLLSDGAASDTANYFASETNNSMQLFMRNLMSMLMAQNILVEKFHHEVAQGQQEVSIKYGDALVLADQLVLAKHTIKTCAKSVGLTATFMPKPFSGCNGSGMHIHFSLFDHKKKTNAFYDAQDPHNFSEVAKQFIAGVLTHIHELTILFNPTVNSYKRLVPGYEAPTNICWAPKNRSSVIRIPEVTAPIATRAELRSPDPLCNPYLAFAALLKAGLTGIKRGYTLKAPVTENLYHLSQEQLAKKGIRSLPASLTEALESFKTSSLTAELGSFKDLFITLKKQEIESFSLHVTDWEKEQYR